MKLARDPLSFSNYRHAFERSFALGCLAALPGGLLLHWYVAFQAIPKWWLWAIVLLWAGALAVAKAMDSKVTGALRDHATRWHLLAAYQLVGCAAGFCIGLVIALSFVVMGVLFMVGRSG